MSGKTSALLLLVLLGFVEQPAGAQDRWRSYIGKSNCIPELSRPSNRYGVRLDRSQNAYVMVYKFKDFEIVTIVQYQDDSGSGRKRCGAIRDVAQLQDKNASVVWECLDRRTPAEVVVGTWPAEHAKPYGAATEAWRADLKDLKFIPVSEAPKFVSCHPEGAAGNDEGDGLSDWARKQADKHSSQ